MSVYAGFCGNTYVSQSPAIDGERAVNLYSEIIPPGAHAKSQQVLSGTPGLKLFATLPTGPVRCLWAGDNRLFAVGGSKLYEVLLDGTTLLRGDVGLATTPAQIISNGNQLFIVSGAQGYLDNGLTVTPVVACVFGTYIDGYFVAQQPASSQFNISGLLDGSMWDPLDFAKKQGAPDNLASTIASHEELWLNGQKTTEVWYDSGAANFPFQRIQGAFIELGNWAPFSIVQLDNSLFWLHGDERGVGIVYRMQGYTPVRISNHAVESAIQSYAVGGVGAPGIGDAVAYAYQENGHSFYVLHFPKADKTWAYDVASGQWGERTWTEPNTDIPHAHLGRFHAYAFGQHLVGNYKNGKIYTQSLELFDDDGDLIHRLRSAPHLSNEALVTIYDWFKLDMQVGGSFGFIPPFLAAGGIPKVILQWSDDGGLTWGNEVEMSAGALGEYRWRVMASRLGISRDRCFRVKISDPIQVALIEAYLKTRPGNGT